MKDPGALSLIDRAIFLFRSSFFQHLWIYYCATVPCLLYAFWFFDDMSTGSDGKNRIVWSALILTVLIIFMKTGQALFCLRSFETLMGSSFSKLRFKQIISCTGFQVILALAELIVVPIAILLIIPFGWCYAFFQIGSMGTLLFENNLFSTAMMYTRIWPRQNHIMLWVICPVFLLTMVMFYIAVPPLVSAFSLGTNATVVIYFTASLLALFTLLINPLGWILFANFLTAIIYLPQVLRILTGGDSFYSMSMATMFHPVVILSTWMFCFLFMDPLVKICYIIRMYDHQSIRSGNDLLKNVSMYVLIILIAIHIISPTESCAETQVLDQKQFDVQVSEVLKNPAYMWREKKAVGFPDVTISSGPLKSMAMHVESYYKKMMNWIKRHFKIKNTGKGGVSRKWQPFSLPINPILLMAVSVVILITCFLIYRRRKLPGSSAIYSEDRGLSVPEAKPVPLLSAEDNSPDEWEELAHNAVSGGDITAGIRYFYLSSVRLIGDKKLLTAKKGRSNREIRRELMKRYPDQMALNSNITLIISNFEYTWFGTVPATVQNLENVIAAHAHVKEQLRRYA